MRKLLAHLGLAIPVVAGLVFGVLLAASPAQAKHPTVQSQIQHYLECLNWMITDPAKHRKLCGPGHEFFLPYNNFAPTGITGMPPVTPPAPPSTPTCPEHNYEHHMAFVQYTDFILVHNDGENGGDWNKPKDDCKPDKPKCPVSFNPSEVAPSVLLVTGNFDCYHPPSSCDSAWTGGRELTPSLLLVGRKCCDGPSGSITDQALVQLAKIGGNGTGPSFNPPGPFFGLPPKPDFNFPEGGYCNEAWTGLPMEAPALLI